MATTVERRFKVGHAVLNSNAEFDGFNETVRTNKFLFHAEGEKARSSSPAITPAEGKPFTRKFHSFRSYRREPFAKVLTIKDGIVLINEHNRITPRTEEISIEDSMESYMEASQELPEIDTGPSLSELGIKNLPLGISMSPNGHFPIEELVNTEALILVKVFPPSTEIIQRAVPKPLPREDSRSFVEKPGTSGDLTKRRDGHYSTEAKANRLRRIEGLLSGEIQPYVRARFIPTLEDLGENSGLVKRLQWNISSVTGEYLADSPSEEEGLRQYETDVNDFAAGIGIK